ncbi:Imm7 family immunity protein [Nocardia sp. NPDC006630]|uniref:Imm7 family immunity protein n=1 Tax=Nocardia sp. NPDC006630 TaxID=3157181 RepID=UPI00339EFEE1
MFEYHGWVTVQSSAGDENDSESEAALTAAAAVLQGLQSAPGLADIRTVNGVNQIHIAGCSNHKGSQGDQVIEVFAEIGRVAPGSYGILYVRDDEDSSGRENEFQVTVMRRGAVSSWRDELLSPCIPVIEDDE